jgi:hypothetical protein
MNSKLIADLELALEVAELKRLELTAEEIAGFIDLFIDNWGLSDDGTYEN